MGGRGEGGSEGENPHTGSTVRSEEGWCPEEGEDRVRGSSILHAPSSTLHPPILIENLGHVAQNHQVKDEQTLLKLSNFHTICFVVQFTVICFIFQLKRTKTALANKQMASVFFILLCLQGHTSSEEKSTKTCKTLKAWTPDHL